MRLPASTPDQIARAPELAALEILDSAADVARRALFAAHPELVYGDFFVEQPDVTAEQCLVVAVIAAIDSLADAVEHCRAHVDNLDHVRPAMETADNPF